MTQLEDLVQTVEHLRTEAFTEQPARDVHTSSELSYSYRLQEDEGLCEQVAEEVVVGQSDALEVSGGVDLLKQLREL